MPDTARPLADLKTLLADNTSGAISPQDARDFLVSIVPGSESTISPSQITADQDDYNPSGLSTALMVRLSSDAARSITGLVAQTAGRAFTIHNIGSFTITLVDASGSSTAANQFALPDGDFDLVADGVALLQYDATTQRWRLLGGGAGGSSLTPPASIEEETPASTGDYIFRVMGGSTGDPIVSEKEGVIIQLYSDDWTDGNPHSALNVFQNAPSGSTYFPYATSTVVHSHAAAGDAVALFARAEGDAAAPKWGANISVSDKITGGSEAAATIVGIEVNTDVYVAGSTVVGIDIVARGDDNPDRGLHIRKDTGLGAVGDWDYGILVQDADVGVRIEADGVFLIFDEADQALPGGLWRFAASAGFLVLQQNTHASVEFSTERDPIVINTDGDVFLAATDGAGSNSVFRANYGGGTRALGFHGATPVAKGTITGSRGGNAALASLLTYLASTGLLTDSSSA